MKSVTRHLAAAAALALALPAAAQELPRTMVWSAYDVGSSGYAQAAGIADAMMAEYGTRIRIVPSGTSIGRLLPMKTGRVTYGWLGNESFFATEAIYDFASREWGPQDLRTVMAAPAGFGLAVAADAGIETLADMRGKRYSRITANPSINVKVDAMLAFAGLSLDDVEVVEVPSYADSIRAVVEGRSDAAGGVPPSSLFRELEASPRGIRWLPVPADNQEGWDRLLEVASFFEPMTVTSGPGISEDNPAELIGYRYPLITVYADTSADEVYNFVKAMHAQFENYQGAHPNMFAWAPDMAGVPPADAPFHEGAIRYFREIGVWTDEHDAWNERRMARMQAVQEAWEAANDAAFDAGVSDSDWPAFWDEHRAKALGG
jgi:TRAP transporter TAXI family solute receptor